MRTAAQLRAWDELDKLKEVVLSLSLTIASREELLEITETKTKTLSQCKATFSAPLHSQLIGSRGRIILCRLIDSTAPTTNSCQTIKRKKGQTVPTTAPTIKDTTTHSVYQIHTAMNHRFSEVLNKFAQKFPDAIKYIRSKDETTSSCPACIERSSLDSSKAKFIHALSN